MPEGTLTKTIEDARRLQEELSKKVILNSLKKEIKTVGGVDAAYSGDKTIACICVLDYKTLIPVEESFSFVKTSFPYISGYLTFREGPAILSALERLSRLPDLLIFDGQGIAHPRKAGIASHIGVLLNIPSIGCAKSRLVGEYKRPSLGRGSREPLYYRNEIVGSALVTRDGCNPLYISPGHLTNLEQSIDAILHLTPRFRIPEPVRAADSLSKKLKTELTQRLIPGRLKLPGSNLTHKYHSAPEDKL